ncbi:MAG: hypothetical protein S4CHLAM7_13500 [Chlamydiae bacterium]|nr:hypothetical protein [Chlamydiota bacterium]
MLHCDPLQSKNKTLDPLHTHTSSFTIENDKGLHTRPSTELVKCSSQFSANIFLKIDDMVVNAKSILGILMLAASKGTQIEITAEGEDAKEAIDAILSLAKKKFYMSY